MGRLFNGTSDRLSVNNDALNITGTALTVAAWIYPGSITHQGGIVARWTGSAGNSTYGLQILSTGNIEGILRSSGTQDTVDGATTLTLSKWQHAAMVKNGIGAGAFQVFLNGVSDGSATSNQSIQSIGGVATEIGRIAAANALCFNGVIAEVGVWNASLSLTELEALASGALPSTIRRQSLVAYWPLYGVDSPEASYSSVIPLALTGTAQAPHPPVTPGLLPKRGFQPMPV